MVAMGSSRLGLVAGEGELASCVARNASAMGMEVVAISLTDRLDPAVEAVAVRVHRVDLVDALSIIPIFRQEGVTEAVMIGKIWRADGFRRRTREAVERVARGRRDRTDVQVLLAFVGKLEEAGITLASQLRYMGDSVPGDGVLGRCTPSSSEWEDVRFGVEVARRVAATGIGQAVAVRDRAVVAVEAAEGTDAMIRRAGRLASGCVVVKVSWPDQDERFDVPAVGPDTIEVMRKARAGVLACEAGRTIMVRKRDTIALADAAGIAVVGVPRTRGGDS
ncbi:MAG: UDP-2,3-diacylglucosamine diphosphatase LpxI [Bacillota bacterium]|nr:UDP-2,3-diacylglucosamine diphosphatase LpxI [Bacillota bacterium]